MHGCFAFPELRDIKSRLVDLTPKSAVLHTGTDMQICAQRRQSRIPSQTATVRRPEMIAVKRLAGSKERDFERFSAKLRERRQRKIRPLLCQEDEDESDGDESGGLQLPLDLAKQVISLVHAP